MALAAITVRDVSKKCIIAPSGVQVGQFEGSAYLSLQMLVASLCLIIVPELSLDCGRPGAEMAPPYVQLVITLNEGLAHRT